MSALRRFTLLLATTLLALVVAPLRAAETIPPAPANHFNDYAGVVDRTVAGRLNEELAQFERDTSNQIVVAVFPKMQSASSIEDYTVRIYQAWGVGTKASNNGAVLFVFRDDRKVRIVTGYGLEGAIPDARAKQIIENEITPRFRAGDFTGGLAAGTRALMAAARGEYRGTGATVAQQRRRSGAPSADRNGGVSFVSLAVGAIIVLFVLPALFRRRNTVYGRGGRRTVWVNNSPWWWGGGGGGWSGGGGGSSWGSSGGSFSGGGGSTGGGGAGGSW